MATSAIIQRVRDQGNISASGERIDHLPSNRYYDELVISLNMGERWF